ncbi:MAG: TolB-like 6-bladed beta-propeller domain-containing protein [Tannerella sp.]|jgi:hypothetical protein|nr:TolB-like 6-bladed beta-propeller domain-containing protein [Tannerella sp.]
MKTKLFIILSLCVFLSGCKNTAGQTAQEQATEEDTVEMKPELPELIAGEVFLKGKEPFGNTVELKGTQMIADTVIFKIGEAGSIIKNNKLLMKTGRKLLLFKFPEIIFERFCGTWGNGPDEFNYPEIVPAPNDSTLICYLYERTKGKLYRMDNDGNILPASFDLGKPEKFNFSSKALVNIAPDDFIYADDSPTGKSIFRAAKEADSIKTHEIFNLALNPKRKSPFSYIGDFVANPGKNRMAYAYKYFKIIKFMDLEAQTVRTVNFEREEFDENSLYKINGLDQNVTHYWGACAQDESVYFLYSGRTPYDVSRENGKNNCYIYVEQYDWNGNPVNKFRLDQWGYFTVDEPDKKIYLFSTNHDDPFFTYDLP